MGFRSSRTNADADADQRSTQRLRRPSRDRSTDESSNSSRRNRVDRVEERFGLTIPDQETADRLQRMASDAPGRVQQWVDEGMPVDAMGDPQAIQAFRQRQADRPPAVPKNVERRNARSVQRSTEAAAETGSAGSTQVSESVRDVVASSGRSLDSSIQRAMEQHMGDSFGDVRIHTGPRAAAACDSIDARAFTVGNHVAFNSGEYDPSSPEGQHVLAHELAHVRQQTGGAVSMLPREDVELEIDPDPQLEREAEETAQRVMEGGELGIQRLEKADIHVQRSVYGEDPYGGAHDEFVEKQKERLYGESEAAAGVELGVLLKAFGRGGIENLLSIPVHEALVNVLTNLPIPDPLSTLAAAFVAGGTMVAYTTLCMKLSGEDIREAFEAAGIGGFYDLLFGDGSETGSTRFD